MTQSKKQKRKIQRVKQAVLEAIGKCDSQPGSVEFSKTDQAAVAGVAKMLSRSSGTNAVDVEARLWREIYSRPGASYQNQTVSKSGKPAPKTRVITRAEMEMERRAAVLMKRDSALLFGQAINKVLQDHPSLYADCCEQWAAGERYVVPDNGEPYTGPITKAAAGKRKPDYTVDTQTGEDPEGDDEDDEEEDDQSKCSDADGADRMRNKSKRSTSADEEDDDDEEEDEDVSDEEGNRRLRAKGEAIAKSFGRKLVTAAPSPARTRVVIHKRGW